MDFPCFCVNDCVLIGTRFAFSSSSDMIEVSLALIFWKFPSSNRILVLRSSELVLSSKTIEFLIAHAFIDLDIPAKSINASLSV